MECGSKSFTLSSLVSLILTLTLIIPSYSKSVIRSLPGYPGELPFKLETGYMGIGENEEIQIFYYFLESERNPEEDPIIFHFTGGPGASGLYTFLYNNGPLSFNFDTGPENITLQLSDYSWTKMASVVYYDFPAGVGFSYATTKEGWTSSDTIAAKQAHEFIRKFIIDHPKFLKSPLYILGVSYNGIITPVVTLDIYNANERNDQPILNIQGYILSGPLSDKFVDFNSQVKYAHRYGLISDDIYKSAFENCHGNYVNIDPANLECINSLQRYEECTRKINIHHILEPLCDATDLKPYCREYYDSYLEYWANKEDVQQALNIREGTIGKWEFKNHTLHYSKGKNDTSCYSYDIFSSVPYHKKLVTKKCRSLIFSGDHEITFPYNGIEQWIETLDLTVSSPWKPFYVDDQIGGYVTTHTQNDFALTFATVKGAGHSTPVYKPKEVKALTERWLGLKSCSSAI